jgi:hypothetical protein
VVQLPSTYEDASAQLLLQLPAAQQLSIDSVAQLLQAGVQQGSNGVRHFLALSAAQLLGTGFAVQLLHAAVAGGQTHLVGILPQLQAAQEMSVVAMEQLLSSIVVEAVQKHNDLKVVAAAAWCIRAIKRFPATRQVPASSVAQLLLAATDSEYYVAEELIFLPAAQQISSITVLQLLHAAVKQNTIQGIYIVRVLGHLPAAHQLSSESVAELLQAAASQDEHTLVVYCVETLLGLHAARQLDATTLAQLLLWVMNNAGCYWPEVASELLKLPAAEQLSGGLVAQLWEASLEHSRLAGEDWFPVQLADLPGAQDISSSSLEHLLQVVTTHDHRSSCRLLLNLPAAQQLSTASVVQLLQPALESNHERCFHLLAALPAARQLSTTIVVQMLQTAVSSGNSRHLELLLELQVVQRLSSSSAVQVLEAAMAAGQPQCMRLLCESPAVQQLQRSAVGQLIQATLHVKCDVCVRALCWLPGASQLDEATVVNFVHIAVEHKLPHCLEGPGGSAGLLSLPAAQRFSSSTIDALLQAAVQAGCTGAAVLLASPSFGAHEAIGQAVATVADCAEVEQ